MIFDFRTLAQYLPDFMEALLETLKIAIISCFFAISIGTIVGFLSNTRSRLLRTLIEFYTGFIRSTPLLVQLYFVHYGLPILNIMPTRFQSATITFSLNTGAYISEIIRGGLQSINIGQFEAAYSLGLSRFQTIRLIIFPQLFRIVLPPLVSQFSYLIKDTSLAAVLTIPELTYMARRAAATTYRPLESFIPPMLMYFAIYFILSFLSNTLEKHLQKNDQEMI
ncbi:amino acid ABC transporter permease [Pseudothermotoga lettingae]|uniref:Polar amino acid ABC transporter, inner membrane subunit n=1 Tax=Pseudothermotoga lettingae (strain ATCC BAA-301 / DSM 14385 / NBRC 107922 / TMO) TaxID=416591 RepID=A8F361_PSELT|nr:amino acid ABC transporter permease [Pseudothermotoga lettingae]ABV32595.1 polar amino acid ABC transporter, inner membrane subunit [Pseudothermotoga lettingae TMO]GLI48418.1 cysteine ABC transporter permease [Pseudothermotoga lettingae TMO]